MGNCSLDAGGNYEEVEWRWFGQLSLLQWQFFWKNCMIRKHTRIEAYIANLFVRLRLSTHLPHSINNCVVLFHWWKGDPPLLYIRKIPATCEQDRDSFVRNTRWDLVFVLVVFLASNRLCRLPKLGIRTYLCWPLSLLCVSEKITFTNLCILRMSEMQDNSDRKTQLCIAGVFVSVPGRKAQRWRDR